MLRATALLVLVLAPASLACLPDNPATDLGETETGSETGETGGAIEDGLFGCPTGECTLVIVSQTIDDRVEVYTAAGPGPRYRGAIDVDLKPNPAGNIAGSYLDEPYGLAFADQTLHVLLGHYPAREQGSLVSFPAASLSAWGNGELIPTSAWFEAGATTGAVTMVPLERLEPLSILVRGGPGDRRVQVGVFANDLFVPEAQWTNPSELLEVEPASGAIRSTAMGCAGAWMLAPLDEAGERVASACDGDEQVIVMAADPEQDGALVPECSASIPFSGKRVRYLAGDGSGGMLVAEQPPIVSDSESSRLWWYAGDCALRGFTELEGAISWELHQLAALASDVGPRWLLARGDGDERGVLVLAGDPSSGSVSVCGRLDALDDEGAWQPAAGGEPLRPHALALAAEGRSLAIGVGPAAYGDASPGWGTVLWVELDDADDPCDAAVASWVDLSASAPAVDAMVPQTWRRAPDVVIVAEVGP
ncbi:hypothetical protein ACNOYE_08955 [Nannocystaceae bacterium ST9]